MENRISNKREKLNLLIPDEWIANKRLKKLILSSTGALEEKKNGYHKPKHAIYRDQMFYDPRVFLTMTSSS